MSFLAILDGMIESTEEFIGDDGLRADDSRIHDLSALLRTREVYEAFGGDEAHGVQTTKTEPCEDCVKQPFQAASQLEARVSQLEAEQTALYNWIRAYKRSLTYGPT